DRHLDTAPSAAAADSQAQRGLALRRLSQVEGHRPRRRLTVARRLGVVPVLGRVTLTNNEVHVLGELLRVLVVQPPHPVPVAMAIFFGAAVGDADLPELLAAANRLPFQPTQV